MIKRILLGIVVLVLVLVAAKVMRRQTLTDQVDRSTVEKVFTYRCTECGEISEYDLDTLNRFVKKGQTETPPNELRRFPCSQCEKVGAVLVQEKYEVEN